MSENPRHRYVCDNDDFFYNECKNVCPKIAEALCYHKNKSCDDSSINTPSSFGLENSEQIIPKYYFSGKDLKGKILECDFFFTIIDSIRNMRILNRYQQQYIERLEKEDCYQLLDEYNKVMEYIIAYIMIDD